ncbi:hypothetical protein [Gryllotalpicola koreensis]|uniref:Uncharacterized protein n=1 Tax=Gryllotalpicola koreensis TaxID=993086 RepID=A0ABP8AA10_9MICO
MSTPTSITQLVTALAGALPTRYKPCVPVPNPGTYIHISEAYVPPATPPAAGQPTQSLCGDASTVLGAVVVPNFAICTTCWEAFVARKQAATATAGV